MMTLSSLVDLQDEVLLLIADLLKPRIIFGDININVTDQIQAMSALHFARVLRTCRYLYHMLNPALYRYSTSDAQPGKTFLLWAVWIKGREHTLARAFSYDVDINTTLGFDVMHE